jgi:hypothetical protein
MRGPRPTAPHGTPAAARRHWRHGEKPCEPCRVAANRYRAVREGRPDDPYEELQPAPRAAIRNALPIVPYVYQARQYTWAAEQKAAYGAPEKDDGACWDREAG